MLGQLRRRPPPPRKTRLASCFVQKWRACEDDAYVHAKCNDKDVPRNSRSPKNGKPSHSVVVRNKVTNGDRTVILSTTFENDRADDQSEDE